MAKYNSKHDLEKGTELQVLNEIQTSYGVLKQGDVVTLVEVTHYPTTYSVRDKSGQSWMLRTYDVEEAAVE